MDLRALLYFRGSNGRKGNGEKKKMRRGQEGREGRVE